MITVGFPTELTASADETAGRRVSGVAVPWGAVGRVADGTQVRFEAGSLDATARPVLLRDHDRARPIGRVVDANDSGTELLATSQVSRTRDGDEALILAADGVLSMFSVGVNPTAYHYDDDGVLVVTAGDWQELSLLTIGAFTAARVVDVAASSPQEELTMSDTITDPPAVTTSVEPVPVTAAAPLPVERPTVVQVGATRAAPPEPLTLSGVARLIAGANRGELTTEAVRSRITAALTDVTLAVGVNNVGAIAQPAYRAEIVGLIDNGRPLIDAIASAPLPASGGQIEYPKWELMPEVGIQTIEKTPVTSVPVKMGMGSAPVLTWAGANDISLQAVERSSPSFLEAYLRAAAVDFARKTDTYVGTQLLAVATPVEAAAADSTFVANLTALLGALNPLTTPAGRLFCALSWDVGIPLMGLTTADGPALWDASINFGSLPVSTTAGGLNIFIDPYLPAGTMLAGPAQGATWHQNPGAPADLRVVDVSLLGLDVGVYGFGALTIEYPGSFTKLTPFTP